MTRWTLAGCMALAALAAVTVLDAGAATAEAAPSVSRFAGTYVSAFNSSWGITISDGGRISSSSGSDISGRVGDDGSYSFTETARYFVEQGPPHKGRWVTVHTTYAGTMELDVNGDIVATVDNGDPLYLLRQ